MLLDSVSFLSLLFPQQEKRVVEGGKGCQVQILTYETNVHMAQELVAQQQDAHPKLSLEEEAEAQGQQPPLK